VGVEVMEATRICFDALKFDASYTHGDIGWEFWCKEGESFPQRTIDLLHASDAAMFGAITSKPVKDAELELIPELQGRFPIRVELSSLSVDDFEAILTSTHASLLKQYQASAPEFEVWEREMALAAVELDQYREAVLRTWKEDLLILLPELLSEIDLRMEYHKGFSTDTDFIEQLRESRHRDRERGHTQIGPHRADLRLKTDGGAVDAVLSRGQKKLLICALKLAQVAVLKAGNRRCVVLLDDLASELDGLARERLLVSLQALQAQVLMTALDPEQLWPVLQRLDRRARLFHVEQGKIVPDTAVAVTEETP